MKPFILILLLCGALQLHAQTSIPNAMRADYEREGLKMCNCLYLMDAGKEKEATTCEEELEVIAATNEARYSTLMQANPDMRKEARAVAVFLLRSCGQDAFADTYEKLDPNVVHKDGPELPTVLVDRLNVLGQQMCGCFKLKDAGKGGRAEKCAKEAAEEIKRVNEEYGKIINANEIAYIKTWRVLRQQVEACDISDDYKQMILSDIPAIDTW